MSDKEDKSPVDEFLSNISIEIRKLKKFWATKCAIDKGIPLYEWTNKELDKEGYLRPWTFNIFKIALVGLISSVASKLNELFYGIDEKPIFIGAENASAEYINILSQTWSWVEPFITPLFFTSLVFLTAWSSLSANDSKPAAKLKARKAFLYFDGAYGFFSQLIISLAESTLNVVLLFVYPRILLELPVSWIIVFALMNIAGLIQTYVSAIRIPKQLFEINGYSDRVRRFWQKPQANDPPWTKYAISYVLGMPIILFIVVCVDLFARFMAHIIVFLRHLAV